MAKDWREAFLIQAKSDFEIATNLLNQPVPNCHFLHYLQMSLEKLSKGLSSKPGSKLSPKRQHRAVERLFHLLEFESSFSLSKSSGKSVSRKNQQAILKSVRQTAIAIENLTPALAGSGPNAEYPWLKSGSSLVFAPIEYDFLNDDLSPVRVSRLVRFLQHLLENLE